MTGQSARNVLVAVDGSDNSKRAVEHVAEVLSGAAGFTFTLLHVIAEPDPDYFGNQPARRLTWIAEQRAEAMAYLEAYRAKLLAAGFTPDAVAVDVAEKDCPSLADCILDECAKRGAGILVLGRQGRGAKEEILMGSVSKAAVHKSKGRAVWVVT